MNGSFFGLYKVKASNYLSNPSVYLCVLCASVLEKKYPHPKHAIFFSEL